MRSRIVLERQRRRRFRAGRDRRTVGDIEGLPFFEAIRQLGNDLPRGHACFIHLTLCRSFRPRAKSKTKPTQHSVKELGE